MSASLLTNNQHVDVIVVGSGAAGMTAALTAANKGCSVLLIEKTSYIGGSTAISGGAIWAPLHSQSEQAGHPDSKDNVLAYLQNTIGEASQHPSLLRFVDSAAQAIDFLSTHDYLQVAARTYAPDYYPDKQGALLGGRSFDPLAFDGRKLGKKHFTQLRNPLPEFLVLNGMMITTTDAKQLLGVFKSPTNFTASLKLLWRYASDRLKGYHRGTRLVLGNALAAHLFYALIKEKIPYALNVELIDLLQDSNKRVTGVRVRQHQSELTLHAKRGVILATGGFPHNSRLRDKYYPKPTELWSMAPADNTGDGIEIALRKKAAINDNQFNAALWAPISINQKVDGSIQKFPHLVWDRAKPGLMAVNSSGKRFVNEATSYHEFVLAMYKSRKTEPSIPSFLVCDSPFIEKWGMGLALPGGRPRQHLIDSGYLIKADTLDELALKLNINADNLKQSVLQFNQAAQTGHDSLFGKGSTAYNQYLGDPDHSPNPCLGSISAKPFYAVKVYPGDIGTASGLLTTPDAQVLDEQLNVIDGLYAVGNDMQSIMGGHYPGPGITLGPGLCFGWLAGLHIAENPLSH